MFEENSGPIHGLETVEVRDVSGLVPGPGNVVSEDLRRRSLYSCLKVSRKLRA